MDRSKLHHRLPILGRAYQERNRAREERDRIQGENEKICVERDEAQSGQAVALAARDRALKDLDAALEARDAALKATDEALKARDGALEEKAVAELALANSNAKLFVPPGHFYSPIVDPIEAEAHFSRLERRSPTSLPDVNVGQEAMVETWKFMLPLLTTAPFPERKSAEFRYAFDNPNYSWGDGGILYATIRRNMPRRIVEIGCGWSSACILDTVERYCGSTRLTFVDPNPALLHTVIGKTRLAHEIIELPVQKVPEAVFESLAAGDILFIDSTHVLRTGSDVCFELFDILPRLPSGTLVHFHDMFWPFEYPSHWIIEEKRSWNELYAIRAFLSHNDKWEVVFFNDYFGKLNRPLVEATYPDFLRNTGGALWLRRI
jgi:predicted O-methyltransferase YrrM